MRAHPGHQYFFKNFPVDSEQLLENHTDNFNQEITSWSQPQEMWFKTEYQIFPTVSQFTDAWKGRRQKGGWERGKRLCMDLVSLLWTKNDSLKLLILTAQKPTSFYHHCVCQLLSSIQLCNPMDCSPPGSLLSMEFSWKNTGVGGHFLLHRIFPIQGSNLGLLHCRQILYHLSHQGRLLLILVGKDYKNLWSLGSKVVSLFLTPLLNS